MKRENLSERLFDSAVQFAAHQRMLVSSLQAIPSRCSGRQLYY